MSFEAKTVNEDLSTSLTNMALLNSSCQAIIEDEVQEVSSEWYTQLDQELGAAEDLVIQWRSSGYLYFEQDILASVLTAAGQFNSTSATVIALMDKMQQSGLSQDLKAQIVRQLNALTPSLQALGTQTEAYLSNLKQFQANMQVPHSRMLKTVSDIQAQEVKIQSEINSINEKITNLQKEITTIRNAIRNAESKKTEGIFETVFGIVAAPFTLGASLVLAGFGIANLVEADEKIDQLQSSISKFQSQIADVQKNLNRDERIIATLGSLTSSVQIALDDMAALDEALSNLRGEWNLVSDEFSQVVEKIKNATTAEQIIVQKAWMNAASNEWTLVGNFVRSINGLPITAKKIRIG